MMNRTTFSKKTFNGQRPPVDRFVKPRECLPELSRKVRWGARDKSTNDVWCTKHLQEKKYAKYLDSAFGLEPIKPETSSELDGEQYGQLWPCIPRTKSYLCSADSILDLPSYSDAACSSRTTRLVERQYPGGGFRKELSQVELAHTESDQPRFHGLQHTMLQVRPQRKTANYAKTVEVHDTELSKRVNQNRCRCYNYTPPYYCSITAMDWSPTGNSFITGCSRGTLVSYTREANRISWCSASRGSIFITRVSPDARYVTAAAVNDDDVLVFTWPRLELFSRLTSDWTIKALSWHPWRSALLGIGAVTSALNARVTLWDAPTGKVRKHTLGRNHYSLDAMLFSERTGELVLSLWNADMAIPPYPKTNSQLLVMSDPDTVVDQWGEGWTRLDRIRTMVFSPDGTKLATATTDEDLIILNFLPEDKLKKKKCCKRFSAMPVYLDKVTVGVSIR
ncbi:unnamed protein product [Arctia plantaginis]|uniref:Cortex n=1 Tax=Arctia plantaginis TaxID=874455 RepID=A0A8S0YWB2_ARCPL|nr:unnamed protein product [Arctia plantaginis]CAB3253846.1 unnamed protein product [Arctia plantaginis]